MSSHSNEIETPPLASRGSQLLPRVYEILVIVDPKYMCLMGDSEQVYEILHSF